MCEATLIIGSSLGKQLSNACKMNHIDSLLFQGKIPLNFVKTELDKRNKSFTCCVEIFFSPIPICDSKNCNFYSNDGLGNEAFVHDLSS